MDVFAASVGGRSLRVLVLEGARYPPFGLRSARSSDRPHPTAPTAAGRRPYSIAIQSVPRSSPTSRTETTFRVVETPKPCPSLMKPRGAPPGRLGHELERDQATRPRRGARGDCPMAPRPISRSMLKPANVSRERGGSGARPCTTAVTARLRRGRGLSRSCPRAAPDERPRRPIVRLADAAGERPRPGLGKTRCLHVAWSDSPPRLGHEPDAAATPGHWAGALSTSAGRLGPEDRVYLGRVATPRSRTTRRARMSRARLSRLAHHHPWQDLSPSGRLARLDRVPNTRRA